MSMTLEAPTCVDPSAPVVACVVCGRPVHTCERREPVQTSANINDYTCPAHPDGCEISGQWRFPEPPLQEQAGWVCSSRCYETWSLIGEFVAIVHESSIQRDDRDHALALAREWRDDAPELNVFTNPPSPSMTLGDLRAARSNRPDADPFGGTAFTIEIESRDGDPIAMELVRVLLEDANAKVRTWKPGRHLLSAAALLRVREDIDTAVRLALGEEDEEDEG